MEKLFVYLVYGYFAIAILKVLVFYLYQRLMHPVQAKRKRTALVNNQAARVSALFNQLLKARVLTREDILSMRKSLSKYACKKYNNDCNLIYSVLKHANVKANELGSLEVWLESKRQKSKC